jgi:transposase
MNKSPDLSQLSIDQLRTLVEQQVQALAQKEEIIAQRNETITQHRAEIVQRDEAIKRYRIREEQMSHEIALLRRHRYGQRSEGLDKHQLSLLQELIDEDTSAVEMELEKVSLKNTPKAAKQQAKRQPLPAQLPRSEIHHEPESTTCACGCQMTRIGEDVSEKLDYQPGTFSVERHIRGKWACSSCETLIQAPVAPHIIDKGIPTTNLLAQVLISKYADHLPLYRQQQIYARAGVEVPRSTLADWVGRCGVELTPLVERLREVLKQQPVLHADETPVAMLAPGKKRTHTAYVWAYAATRFADIQGVVYDFRPSRAGQAARDFLEGWKGKLVCDDYIGYKAGFEKGMTEIGCMAHARRKFHDLHVANQSPIAEKALRYIALLYDIEREAARFNHPARQQLRQDKAKPVLDKLRQWLIGQREQVPNGTSTAKAIDYSLKRWEALTRYVDDGQVPIDNNWVENQIRPWALGRSNWLFAGSLRSGQRAANIMSLIQSAKINGLDPQAYLKDVMERMPTIKYSNLDLLLPHQWKPDNTG